MITLITAEARGIVVATKATTGATAVPIPDSNSDTNSDSNYDNKFNSSSCFYNNSSNETAC